MLRAGVCILKVEKLSWINFGSNFFYNGDHVAPVVYIFHTIQACVDARYAEVALRQYLINRKILRGKKAEGVEARFVTTSKM